MNDDHRLLIVIAIGYKEITSQGGKHDLVTIVINIGEMSRYYGRLLTMTRIRGGNR